MEKKQKLKIKHIRSFILNSNPDSTAIGSLFSKFTINENGNRLAFYDNIYNRFLVTDKEGNVMYTVGKKGKGPKELVQVLSWNFDEHDNLIVFDEGQKQVKIFGPAGNLNKTSNVLGNGFAESSRYLFAKDNLIYMGTIETKFNTLEDAPKSSMIAVYDYGGQMKGTLGKYDPYVSEATNYTKSPIFNIDFSNNKIYSTQRNSYRIQIFNLNDSERMAYFGYKSHHYKESEEEISPYSQRSKIMEMTLNQSFPDGLFITSEYILHFFQNLTEKWNQTRDPQYKEYFLTIYDRESHNFVAELNLPYYLATVNDDKLYLIENSNPDNYTIGVYEIQTAN